MNRAQIIIALALPVAASGCSRKVTEAVTRQYDASDSVRVVETLRIDTVSVPGETVYLEVAIPAGCDSLLGVINTLQENGRASVTVSKRARTATAPAALLVKADCKEYQAQVRHLERETQRLRATVSNSTIAHTVREQYVAWYHRWALYWTAATGVALVIWLAWTAVKLYLKLS